MAEPLKNHFGLEVAAGIAAQIRGVAPDFDAAAFMRTVRRGFEPLNLMARGRHIALALHQHLPGHYPEALSILMRSLGPRPESRTQPLASFFYLPHTQFVAEFGLGHVALSLDAQHALTRRFTAEFSIRPFLIHHPRETLARLWVWVDDPDVHVRRLVSEGTRPRLPWGIRLKAFQADPTPVLGLLEKLRDDPEPYVRRSVANHLNDIGKDHPDLLARIAARWWKDAPPGRRWIVTHALRSAVKRGEAGALRVLGCARPVEVRTHGFSVDPRRPQIGGKVRIGFRIRNSLRRPQRIMADLRIHFVKAGGKTSPKVFKLKQTVLAPGAECELGRSVSLKVLTTRKPYPGRHRVEALLNGRPVPLGAFDLRGPKD